MEPDDKLVEEVKKVHAETVQAHDEPVSNEPKGLPEMTVNEDRTSLEYPTRTSVPDKPTWREIDTISGSGGGPKL